MPSFLLCDRPIDLKGNEATNELWDTYVPNFFYFIQSEERTSTPWGGKGGEGDDKEL